MPTIAVATLYFHYPKALLPIDKSAAPYLILAVLVSTFVIPALSMVVLRVSKTLSSLTMRNRKERITPFLWIFLFYGFTTYLLIVRINVNAILALIMIVATLLILVLTAITLRFKISVHMAAMGGLAGFFTALSIYFHTSDLVVPLSISFLLGGIVGTARLYLNAHSSIEVSYGYIFGYFFCLLPILIFQVFDIARF